MLSVIKSTWKVFMRNADYVEVILGPLLMLLIFSFILSFSNEKVVGVTSGGKYEKTESYLQEAFDDADRIRMVDVKPGEGSVKVLTGDADAVVDVDDATGKIQVIAAAGNEDFAKYLQILADAAVKNKGRTSSIVACNEDNRGGVSIANSLGVVIFKIITGAALLGGTLIYERNRGIKQRINITGIRYSSYIIAKSLVYFVNAMVALVLYYLLARIMNFDFGMENTLYFLLIMIFINIYAIALYCMLSVFCNNRNNLWSVAVCIILPMSLLSGTFVQFNRMPKILQTIGNCFPQRWVCIALEKIQQGQGLRGAFPALSGLVALSVVFYIVTFVKGKNLPMAAGNSVDS